MPTFGVLGSGEVGQMLAKGLKDHGYQVRIGSRTPAKLADYSKQTGIQAGTFAEVARWGEAHRALGRGQRGRGGAGHGGTRRASRQARHRHHQPDRRRAAGAGRAQVHHRSEHVAHGAAAARLSRGQIREGVQLRGQRAAWSTRTSRASARRCSIAATTPAPRPRSRAHPRSVRLGSGGHGRRDRRARHRAAGRAVVHSGISPGQLDPRVPAAAREASSRITPARAPAATASARVDTPSL